VPSHPSCHLVVQHLNIFVAWILVEPVV
jgi:hypothetical protein